MAHRSLRHRSSRFSSPATFGEKETAPAPASVEEPVKQNGQQISLDSWVEPPLRAPAPSFEDSRGLERMGVLENMHPLGTAPSQRLLQKLKLTYTKPSPRATPAQVMEEVVTPVTESAEKMDLASPMEEAMVEQRTERNIEPSHNHPAPLDTILVSSPPRGRPPGRQSTELQFAEGVSPSSMAYPYAAAQHASPKPLSIQQQLRQDRLRTHVGRAIQEAQQKNTPDLADGLKRLRDDAQVNYDLWNVVETMMGMTPDPEHFKIFKHYIKSGVKKHRRDSQMSASPYQPSPRKFQDLASPSRRERSPRLSHAHNNPTQPPPDNSNNWLHRYPPEQPAGRADGSEEMTVSPSTAPPHFIASEPNGRSSRQRTSHKRKRSGSFSTSSLSSLPSNFEENLPPASPTWEDGVEGQEGSGRSDSAGQRQATSRGASGSRLRSAVSATYQLAQPFLEPLEALPEATSRTNNRKRFKKARDDLEFDIDELSKRKRPYLDDSFHDYNTIPRPESDEREPVHGHPERPMPNDSPPLPVLHTNPLSSSHVKLNSLQGSSLRLLDDLPVNGASRKRGYEEIDVDDLDVSTPESYSPGPPLVPPPPPGVARWGSRAATPRAAKQQAATKTRKSARVLVSPNKPKNGGITAGIARAGPGHDAGGGATNGNGADSGVEDNDEVCTSCGGEGKLLCCDGCTNSFHHACLEPPLNPDEDVDGEWFCPQCLGRRSNEAPSPVGLLGVLVRRVGNIIPKAYTLPIDVRDYFEGVRTGEEGEYEEVALPRTQNNVGRMNRAGFIEEPNYKENRDSKGNIIRCYHCNTTSNGRDIIPCDFCPAKWHLDCLDPPLAVPPRRRAGDKPGATWRCPLHADQDLLSISRQAEKAPGDLGRVPKTRKPRNAIPLDVDTARSFRNNGVIDIEFMPDQPDPDKLKELQMNGKIYRVPEMGIRLDFIDRVKKSWYEDHSLPRLMDAPKKIRNRKYRPNGVVLYHPPQQSIVKIREPDFFTGANALAITETAKANVALRRKSLREQQTVLNLAQMSQKGIDGYSGDTLAELTNALVSEAPDKVVSASEKTEVDQLLQLQELISKRLSILKQPKPTAPMSTSDHPRPNGNPNGERLSTFRDPNIDPMLQGGGFNVLPTAKAFSDQDLPIDPALQMSAPISSSKTKVVNGYAADDGHDQDADDEDEEDFSRASVDDASRNAWLSNREASRRWLDETFPPNSTPARYGSVVSHPLSKNGHGNGNGVDQMEMGP